MDLLHLYLTKYAKKASDTVKHGLDILSESAGMESDSDTTDVATTAGEPSTGTRGAVAPTARSSTVGTTRSPAASTTAAPTTAASTTRSPAAPTTAAPTSTSVVGATPLSDISSFFLNTVLNEALAREYPGYRNPITFRNEKLKEIDETAKTVLDEVFKTLPEIDNPINRILEDERRQRAELMNRGARSVIDPYVRYRTLQAAQGRGPRNPIAAEELQQRKRLERLETVMRNHALAAQEREAHIRALEHIVRRSKDPDLVPSFDEVFNYAKLIVPNTFGITGYPNKARANVILKDLARYAALKEDPDAEQVVNGVAAALDRLKNGPVSQVGRVRDTEIVRRGLEYLVTKSQIYPDTLKRVFGAGNSEYRDIVANVGLAADIREDLGL